MNKWFVLLTLGFLGMAAYGFRADEWPTTDSSRGAKATAPAVAVRQPSAEQLQAASQLQDVDIQWDQKTGAPLSVRGKLLGTQNLGGKGLTATDKGYYAQDAIAIMDSLTDVYAIQDAQKEFAVFRVDADNIGFHHAYVRQMYQGLRVVGGEVIVHFNKDKQAYQVNGKYIPGIAVDITLALKPEEAVASAQADLKARGKPEGTLKGNPELVIFAANGQPKLAYELALTYPPDQGKLPGQWIFTVDALSGKILNAFNSIPTAAATITGNRLLGEGGVSVSVTGTSESGAYWLKSSLWLIHNSDTTGSFPDSNNDARRTTAAWGTTDPIEISAAYNLSAIQSYYSTVHGRNSYNNSGVMATMNVHYEYGSTYNNAYWSPSEQKFFFYDGDGVSLNGLTVTDVAAHEFTHAVTEYTANLTYQNESGALNESFSDIFGALVEFYYQPNTRSSYPNKVAGGADWLLAEDSMISATAMRDMKNPSSTTTLASGAQQPSKYNGTYWYSGSQDSGGVHINSGVQNFFFYLLCEGGSGNNDGTSYNVTGIGIDNAAQVAYRALTVYCTASTDYSAARTAWISAAQDLNSSWVSSVQAAWDGVGVTGGGSQPTVLYTPLMNDIDGDYYGDPTLYHASTGTWYFRLSSAGYALYYLPDWGGANYRGVAGLFDNDWLEDPTLYSTSTGYWYILLSTTGYQYYYPMWWGAAGATPVCADFDGDWFADPTYYLSGYWYILLSTAGWQYYYPLAYSAPSGYMPFGGDFDGDWYADPTFYSPYSGYWYLLLSSSNYRVIYTLLFGASGYTPALGDFDGDYRADPVLRSTTGTWYVLLSSTGYQRYTSFSW